MNKINKLIKVADQLDKLGLHSEADQIDFLIKRFASRFGNAGTKTPEDLLVHLTEFLVKLNDVRKLIGLEESVSSLEEESEDVVVLELDARKAYNVFNRLSDLLMDLIIPTATTVFNKYPRTLFYEIVDESNSAERDFIEPTTKRLVDMIYSGADTFSEVENIIIMDEIKSVHNTFKDFYDRVTDIVTKLTHHEVPSKGVKIPFEESDVTKVDLTEPS